MKLRAAKKILNSAHIRKYRESTLRRMLKAFGIGVPIGKSVWEQVNYLLVF